VCTVSSALPLIRDLLSCSVDTHSRRHVGRYDGSQRGKVKEVRIPVTSNASFEEVCDGAGHSDIEQLARLLDGSTTEMRVRLTEPSLDVSTRRRHSYHEDNNDVDLPRNSDINLKAVFVEQCVLASVNTVDQPAFHLPLRTDIDVRPVDRHDSPLQSPLRPRLSTMDRCVEALYDDDLTASMMNCRRDSNDCKRSVTN